MLTAIIVAAGTSSRFGTDKLFALLAGKPVLWHTLASFAATKCVDEIMVVTQAESVEKVEDLAREFPKVTAVVPGGERRQDSVAAGLEKVTADFVAVHDAARALIEPGEIDRTFAAAQKHGAAALAAPIADTVKRADRDLRVCESVARDGLFAMQTPQIFRTKDLREAYARLAKQPVTDEVSALEAAGKAVQLVVAQSPNPKITFPADLAFASAMIASQTKSR